MSVRILSVLAISAMALAACGDDTGGAGGSGGGAGGEGTTSTTTTTTGGEGGSTTTTTGGGGEGGEGTTTTGGGGEGGGGEAPPCADECADDAGCSEVPANPEDGGACSTCVAAEGAMGTESDCAVAGAFSPCCQGDDQGDDNCVAYVNCVIAGTETCDDDFPAGSGRAALCVLESCGNCGSPE